MPNGEGRKPPFPFPPFIKPREQSAIACYSIEDGCACEPSDNALKTC